MSISGSYQLSYHIVTRAAKESAAVIEQFWQTTH
jgi:hypothetical protein